MKTALPRYWDRFFILFISLLGIETGLANESCSEQWVCISTKTLPTRIEVYAANKQPYPVTVSIRFNTQNLTPRSPTKTATLSGNTRSKILQFRKPADRRRYDFRYQFDWAIGDAQAQPSDYLYALPYAQGDSYRVLQGFGSNFSHQGLEEFAVDFDMPSGSPVHAARAGVVTDVVAHNNRGCWRDGCGKYANFIVISHQDGTTGEYYHLQKNGAVVKFGQSVARGQLIGYSGNTGHTTMPHLHFAVYRPTSWGKTQSLPFKFEAARGIITKPRAGQRYVAR